MARPRRSFLMVRLSGMERLAFELAAAKRGLRLATWAREVLLGEAAAKGIIRRGEEDAR